MEKLIYINSLGREIEFSRSSTYRLREIDGLGGLSSSFMKTIGPFQDGATSVDNGYFETRIISIEYVIVSDDLAQDIRSLNNIFNPKLGAGIIKYYRDNVVRTLRGVKTKVLPELPAGKDKGTIFQVSSIILECFDPYFKDENETESAIASQYDLFTFDVSITDEFAFDQSGATGLDIANLGDVPAPVTILLDGPLTAPIKVSNTSTGESVVVYRAIQEGYRLVIETKLEKIDVKILNLTTLTETSAFQYIDIEETTFWSLEPGINNLVFTHGQELAESVIVKHQNRYVGV